MIPTALHRPLAIGLLVAVAFAVLLTLYDRSVTQDDARITVAIRESLAIRKSFLEARARADSAESRFGVLAVQYRAARAQRQQAIASGDAAVTAARAVADSARAVLSDSTATVQALREQVTTLLATTAQLDSALHVERRAADSLEVKADTALIGARDAIALKDSTIALGDSSYTAEHKVTELLQHRRPWYARALDGLVTGGATLACTAGGYALAGPLGAIGGGAACAAIVGVVRR